MNMQKKYKGFTLVEMLIVMGILVVLMGIGVAVGRFAIQRANRLAHQNAVRQLFEVSQAYYTDNRNYLELEDFDGFGTELVSGGEFSEYIDAGFDGGGDATYYYFVSADEQSLILCVTLGGPGDEDKLGIHCEGNGYNETSYDGLAGSITRSEIEVTDPVYDTIINSATNETRSVWDSETGW